jgi:hypothetical protein
MTDTVYTPEVTAEIVARYTDLVNKGADYETRTALVAEIAKELEVEVASVRGKLSSEKVYVAKAPAKDSKSTVTKEAIAKAVGAVVGTDVPTLAKASKRDLETLWNFLRTSSDQFHADRGVTEPQA